MNIFKSLSTHKHFIFILVYAAFFAWTSTSSGEVLYLDDFEDAKIDGKYEFKNHDGDWVEKGGVISQTHENPGDHTYSCLRWWFSRTAYFIGDDSR